MKVALVHDWLTGYRGGEKCLDAFLSIFPDADIYTLIHIPGKTSRRIDERVVQTSFLQKIPGIQSSYRYFLPFFPKAVKSFSFEGYDLVISLSHAAVKNIEVPEGVPHLCYCFTPMRYVWDQIPHYFGRKAWLLWPILKRLRAWDKRKSKGVTQFVAISKFVAARIRCFYGRKASIIYPPVDTSWIEARKPHEKGKAFLYAGALVPYKRPDLVVKAFLNRKEELWIAGSGPMESQLKEMATENIHFLGRVTDKELARAYRDCRALIFPGKEDFGMVPVECLAAGRPIIGLAAGGLCETVDGILSGEPIQESHKSKNGVFIPASEAGKLEGLEHAIQYFIEHEDMFSSENCIRGAQQFSPERFFHDVQVLLGKTPDEEALRSYA